MQVGRGVRLLTASPDVCTLSIENGRACVGTPKGNVHAQGSLGPCKYGRWMASLRVYGVDGVTVVHPYDCM